MSCAEVFSDIYRRKVWGDGSGGGADPDGAAARWADIVSDLIRERRHKSVVSVGCGDGWADSRINLGGVHGPAYVGVDVVPEVIAECQRTHKRGIFLVCDAVMNPVTADMILVKEVTQHLSDRQVLQLIANLTANVIVHCSAMSPGDSESVTGGYRPVRLSAAPFNLPFEPLAEWEYGGVTYQAEAWKI